MNTFKHVLMNSSVELTFIFKNSLNRGKIKRKMFGFGNLAKNKN